MSDKKNDKKPAKTAADTAKKPTIKLNDGTEKVITSSVLKSVDGKVVEVIDKNEAVKDLLEAKGMLITVGSKDKDMIATYGLSVKRCDNGNLLLSLEASKGMASEWHKLKSEEIANGLYIPDERGLKLIGRSANMEAMYAMQCCYEAYTTNLGLQNAYTLVRLELQNLGDGLKWHGLFVPTLKVMGE